MIARTTTPAALLCCLVIVPETWGFQDRFESLPGFDRYQAVSKAQRGQFARQRVHGLEWSEDGRTLRLWRGRDALEVDLESGAVRERETAEDDEDEGRRGRRAWPGRGRQRDREVSPDARWTAVCRDWNVVLVRNDDEETEVPVTTDGDRKLRYGTASWVYGEELDQNRAMWWSPDSRKLVFYEFDERQVPDHYLTGGLTELHTKLLIEGYPKPGEPNPVASLIAYDLERGEQKRIDTAIEGDHYIYDIRFAPDGGGLLFNRTNRHQNVLEVVLADLESGVSRTVLTERQETWQKNSPVLRFLDDGHRFIWETERSGWAHYELRDLASDRVVPLTSGSYPCETIVHVDEERGHLYYLAYGGEHPLHAHLYRVGLDGSGSTRLTQEPLHHSGVEISPDGRWFVATAQNVDAPPVTSLYDAAGRRVAVLSAGTSVSEGPAPELFRFKAADGATDLYGVLYKPSDFDPSRSYPMLVDVYGGPLSRGVTAQYRGAMPACELGFLVAKLDNRGTVGRGKAFEGATYLKLGEVDLDDQVAGVRHLAARPYVDGTRVGIYGHSYGGYLAALAVLRYPDVFHVAVAGAPVTDWKNYDTIYTERFMRTPEENPEGYEFGSCLTYADQLEGRLLLVHGMVDDNVHPNNVWQLIDALYEAKRPFDMKLFPKNGHGIGSPYSALRWEYLHDHLIGAATDRRAGGHAPVGAAGAAQ